MANDANTGGFPDVRGLLEDATRRSVNYLGSLADRSVAPAPEAIARLAMLDEPLPDGPTEPRRVIEEIARDIESGVTHGRSRRPAGS